LHRTKITALYEVHTKDISTLSWQNLESVDIKPIDRYSNHWALKG